jgi:hypothetical protein
MSYLFCVIVAAVVTSCEDVSSLNVGYDTDDPKALQEARPLKDRDAALSYLTRILRTGSSNGQRVMAAMMLGQLRAQPRALLESIELRTNELSRLTPLAQHVAADALVNIGSPAYPDIFTYCNRELSDRKLWLLAWVIHELDGKEVGLFRIRNRLQQHRTQINNGANAIVDNGSGRNYEQNLSDLVSRLEKIDSKAIDLWPLKWKGDEHP